MEEVEAKRFCLKCNNSKPYELLAVHEDYIEVRCKWCGTIAEPVA